MGAVNEQKILHLDADAFFASVEQAADPRLRGRPVAVGGEKRGVVASASYEARRLGVYTTMPTARARKLCPSLVVVSGDFEKYERFSRLVFSYAYDFTPTVEISSIDEGYADLTGNRKKSPHEIAVAIRRAVHETLKITLSGGVGSNKLVSAVASKLRKPDALIEVSGGSEREFLAPLEAKWLPGIGPKLAETLRRAGLSRIGHIAETPPEQLSLFAGAQAGTLWEMARGIDARMVIPDPPAAKSLGEQETFERDTTDEHFARARLRQMADRLLAKLRSEHRTARTLEIRIRYNDFDDSRRSESFLEPTDLESDVYPVIDRLLRRAWERRVSLRLVGLKLSNLYAAGFQDTLALAWEPSPGPANKVNEDVPAYHIPRGRRHDVAQAVDRIREDHGSGAILRGHDLFLKNDRKKDKKSADSPLPRKSPNIGAAELVDRAFRCAMPTRGGEAALAPQQSETSPGCRTGITRCSHPARAGLPSSSSPAFNRTPRDRTTPPLHAACFLNIRSSFSFLDSLLSPEEVVRAAAERGANVVAITDPNLHGAVEFCQAAKEAGIRPILAATVNLHGLPQLAYVKDQTGYENLCAILSGKLESGEPLPSPHRSLISSTDGLLLVPANTFPEVRYAEPGERPMYHILQSIRTLTLLETRAPSKRMGHFHFPAAGSAQGPETAGVIQRLFEECAFTLPLGGLNFPHYCPKDGSSPHDFLARLAKEGLAHRYGRQADKHRAQLAEELEIIATVGYEEYFLLVWDILQDCRREGIDWITRGSAADSLVCYCLGISDVCPIRFELYFKRFLNKDRMALNKLPDIDVDFAHDSKDRVVDLIFEKYGVHAAVVGGFSTYRGRSAFADIAKVFGVSEQQIRRYTEHLPHTSAARVMEAAASSRECADLDFGENPYATALALAKRLDGFPRHPKMHPCGIVLSRNPVATMCPLFTSHKGRPTTHFNMDAVEAIGLVKMDILAQGGLAVMRDAREKIGNPHLSGRDGGPSPSVAFGKKVGGQGTASPYQRQDGLPQNCGNSGTVLGLEPCPPDAAFADPRIWQMIASGNARGVHHIESPAMTSLNRMVKVNNIDDLIAIVSVIRPGAANTMRKVSFVRRAQGLEAAEYPHPSLEPVLRSTYGVVAYEEHILQICEAFANMPAGRADMLRRALVKNKADKAEAFFDEFAGHARQFDRKEEDITRVWQLIMRFKGYAFCRAHSTAYGIEAYQAAWLKCYHPAEFLAAVLTHGKGFYDRLTYSIECRRLGISFLSPDVNLSTDRYDVTHQRVNDEGTALETSPRIRVPLWQIKGLSSALLARWNPGKPFESFRDFYLRTRPSVSEMESLIRGGALDGFGQSRVEQFWEARRLLLGGGESSLFDLAASAFALPATESPPTERLRDEMELLGFAVSGHPLEIFPNIAWETYCPISRLSDFHNRTVTLAGMILTDRAHRQSDGRPMKFLSLCDPSGIIECELFASAYARFGIETIRHPIVEITATVQPFENQNGCTLNVRTVRKARET